MSRRGSAAISFADVVTHLNQLSTGLAANAADLPHMEGHRVKLKGLLDSANDLVAQQKTHTATKQDLSRQIEAVLKQSKTVSSFLRAGLREHYGAQSEKLVEFDMQPFRLRGRAKGKAPQAVPVSPAEPHPVEPTTPKP